MGIQVHGDYVIQVNGDYFLWQVSNFLTMCYSFYCVFYSKRHFKYGSRPPRLSEMHCCRQVPKCRVRPRCGFRRVRLLCKSIPKRQGRPFLWHLHGYWGVSSIVLPRCKMNFSYLMSSYNIQDTYWHATLNRNDETAVCNCMFFKYLEASIIPFCCLDFISS